MNLAVLAILLILPFRVYGAVNVSVTPTGDNVLPGGVRSIYSYVQGDADTSVTWTASGGRLAIADGYTTWTAPDAPGNYTVTATSVSDKSRSAVATFTVYPAKVQLSNIPMQATVFRNQPVVIQSILWGSTNSSVAWSASGGSIKGTGREVVFQASAAGIYKVTARSRADNSKSATTTIVVTPNPWPGKATPNKTQPIDCTPTGSGRTYNVTSEAGMDAVPWPSLGPGDTVRVHAGPIYRRQLLLSASGTDSQPIRICGVADANGNLPELNGASASAKAGTSFGSAPWSLQNTGGIVVYKQRVPYYGGAVYPKNIIIEGLKLTGYNASNMFTDVNDRRLKSYGKGASSVRVQHGGNITIRGNEITNCGNGIFTMAKDGIESGNSRNILVEGNYIHGNGVSGSFSQHQSYLQAFGLVVQGNYFDFVRSGALGGQLKTRSVQQFIRYNYLKSSTRMLDLVEEQDSTPLVFPWVPMDVRERSNTSLGDVIGNLEAYQNQFVYGNILHNTTSGWIVHGAADTNPQEYNYGGTIYFYHNTVRYAVPASFLYRSGVFDFGPYQYSVTPRSVWPTARVTNNVFYFDEKASPRLAVFSWNRYMPDRVALERNWISAKWGTGNTAGGDGTGISNRTVKAANVWQGAQKATQVSGMSNLISSKSAGTDPPPFDINTYIPIDGGPLINNAVPLPGMAVFLPPLMQFSTSKGIMIPRSPVRNLGASE